VTLLRVTLFDSTTFKRSGQSAVHVDGRVVLQLPPVGLEICETVLVNLLEDRLISRLGTAGSEPCSVSGACAAANV
jgi:hypothetical protein